MAAKLVHFEIPAQDVERGLGFYKGLFGWEFESYPAGPYEYFMTRTADDQGGAVHDAEAGPIPGIYPYFDVDDIRAASARVRELGGEAEEPGPVPNMGWYCRCRDTEGNHFGLWQNDENAPVPEGLAG